MDNGLCFAWSACAGTMMVGAPMRTPSCARTGGMAAVACSLAILYSNPRNLWLRCKPDPLLLGHFVPSQVSPTCNSRFASADWGLFFIIDLIYYFSKSCATWRLRLLRHDLRIFFPRVASGTPYARVGKVSFKKRIRIGTLN